MSFLSILAETLGKYEKDGPGLTITDNESYALLGNGGSSAIAMHIANDLTKQEIAAIVPNYSAMTCLANDEGWESAMVSWLRSICEIRPCRLIVISSSGESFNLIQAARFWGRDMTVTLTGFNSDNNLRKLGHTNYYVPSHNYGIVECAHLAILHSIVNPGEL